MSPEASNRTRCAGELALVALALAAGVAAFVQSYGRWLHPFIDTGRDLYIPEQLRLGAKLYEDILYFYPPLVPYLLAGITSITGASLSAYTGIGAFVALATAFALWSMARPLAGPWAAGSLLLLFFSFSMAGVGGWGSNYFFPYSHSATWGMLFLLAGAAILVRPPAREIQVAVGLFLLLAAGWTKIEYAAFAIAVVLFAAVTGRIRTRWLFAFLATALVTAAASILYFGVGNLSANVLPRSLLAGEAARLFYDRVSGVDRWKENLLLVLRGALLLVSGVALLRAWDRIPRAHVVLAPAMIVVIALLANPAFFRAWALLQLLLIPFALRRPREPLAFLLLLSLCGTSRIYLNLAPSWYGFVYVLPVEILIVYVLFQWLPDRGVYATRTALWWLPLLIVVSASGLLSARVSYAEAHPVPTHRGTYFDTSARRAESVSALLAHLDRVGADSLVVMPEGLAINYLSRVPTPARYQTFTPAEIAGQEKVVLEDLRRASPARIAIVPRDVREFGYRGFGIDYGLEIVAWIRQNYEEEQRFDGIVLLRVRTPRGTPRPDSPSARTPAPSPS